MTETDIINIEVERQAAEAFIPLVEVYGMVNDTLRGRVTVTADPESGREHWQLNPLESWYAGGSKATQSAGELTDVVLPARSGVIRHGLDGEMPFEIQAPYDVPGRIRSGFVQRRQLQLDAHAAAQVGQERASLENTLTKRQFGWRLDKGQGEDAYHVSSPDTAVPGSDGQLRHPLRVYIPAGVNGVRLLEGLIREGVTFAGAKAWTLEPREGAQEFRNDTPIIEVHTLKQLNSVTGALRTLVTADPSYLPSNPRGVRVAGLAIEGLPGVFVAQTLQPKDGYHGQMAGFWADDITDAVREGFPDFPSPKAGEEITPMYVQRVSERARELARQRAEERGLNPECPALLADQDATVVREALKLPAA